MNNNRNNNRRRGRGNRQQGGGGGNQMNRIDSRARGNAPQMLDKYKKLAQDAQHNGDRVQAEYYLQFADHYFRVLADNKARQDEQRGKRYDERDQDDEDEGEDEGEGRQPRKPRGSAPVKDGGEIDAALPPSIGDAAGAEAPKKKRAPRARKAAEPADDGEAVRAVG